MEDSLYLTDELKAYYMDDFQNLFSFNGSDFWDIDGGLETLLKQINTNFDLQTLYSKKFKIDPDLMQVEGESYLELAFSKKIRTQLLQKLNQVKNSTVCKKSLITIMECEPCDNPNYQSESKFEIGCINNPEYFRIKHMRIQIESLDIECHELFWQNIESAFVSFN